MEEKVKVDYLYKIVITQVICVVLIMACILVVKYFFKSTYIELKNFYEIYICDDTSVEEVLKEGLDEI